MKIFSFKLYQSRDFIQKSLIILLIISFLSGCALFNGKSDRQDIYIQEGDRYISEGNYPAAIKSYAEAVKKNPKAIETRKKLGEAYANGGNNALALNEFSEIIRLDPKNIYAHNYRGYIYINQSSWEEAASEFEYSLNINPNNLYALNHLGLSYKMLNRMEEAKSTLQKAVELDPEMIETESKNTHSYLGLIYKDENKYDNAIAEYRKVLERFPADKEVRSRLGEILELKGDYQDAIAEYNAILAVDPNDEFARPRLNALQQEGVAGYEIPPVDIVKEDIEQYISNAPDPSQYPNAGAIIVLDKISYEIMGTGRTRYTVHWIAKIINEIGIAEYGEIAVPFNSRYQNIGVNVARTILPDGKEIHAPLDAYHDITMPGLSDYNMYSDIMMKVVSMPALQPGAIIEFKATLEDAEEVNEKPWIWGSMSFQSSEPILNAKCVLRVPKDHNIKWKLQNCQIDPVITEDDKNITYIWISKDNPEIRTEPSMPPLDDIVPGIVFTSTNSWDEVYKWYKDLALPQEKFDSLRLFSVNPEYETDLAKGVISSGLIQDFSNNGIGLSENAIITAEDNKWLIADGALIFSMQKDGDALNVYEEHIRQKVAELIAGEEQLDEKIKTIYEFVASEIRYVAIELGQGAYQPYAASDVFRYRYGDCKDKTTLLVAMLRNIGVEAYQALISPAPGKETDLDMPSIAQFSHVIVAIPSGDGNYIWLDPTVSTCRYGDLPAGDQGRKAFIIGDSAGEFVDTPLYSSEANKIISNSEIAILQDGSIKGWEQTTANGQADMYMRAVYRLIKPNKIKETLESILNQRYPGMKIENFSLSNLDNMEIPVEIKISFVCPDYAPDKNGMIIFHVPSEDFASYASIVSSEERIYDLNLDYNMSVEKNLSISFPDDYTFMYPENVTINNDIGSFTRKYEKINDSQVNYHVYFGLNRHIIPSSKYNDLKNMMETAAKEDRAVIVLMKSSRRR